ncbi:MAG: DUF503 domain-containing protein [Limnochordaceae bacterium]|uniref:DUF503 domain-containing protein n=1 Tax=Carboxydichorda subterranea TaxID=3109565 RepID=A0ABZ1C0R9_9FIRM|nr:DUF503 domain-containing protein [Limnochorda sp. L945t]MBE3597989.1 DUF503 domain-containing protein [Limnochordaceae bacterium]WRP18483.1 DUF503 domain-containing protein [Limnochorda sp. L945t]
MSRAMVVAVASAELWISGSESLKDRRRVTRAVVDRLRARYNVSVLEMDEPLTWQRARLAVACVSHDEHLARELMDSVRRVMEGRADAELTEFSVVYYHQPSPAPAR